MGFACARPPGHAPLEVKRVGPALVALTTALAPLATPLASLSTLSTDSEDSEASLPDEEVASLRAQQAILLEEMRRELGLSAQAFTATAAVFSRAPYLGQGNPKISTHPMSRAECRARRHGSYPTPGDALCGAPNMIALFDPSHEAPEQARACIDQFEYPNLPCEYPVVWVRPLEAAELCAAQGKRLCDAHEWESACAGSLAASDADYDYAVDRREDARRHNLHRQIVWAYGAERRVGICATAAQKSPACLDGGWEVCGSNTYPAGAFPKCISPLGVYDQHGNVAEIMNLPRAAAQLASSQPKDEWRGLGETELKGSWFAFDPAVYHEDDCRWRAPSWHVSAISAPGGHHNYHLGFRCCRSLAP